MGLYLIVRGLMATGAVGLVALGYDVYRTPGLKETQIFGGESVVTLGVALCIIVLEHLVTDILTWWGQ